MTTEPEHAGRRSMVTRRVRRFNMQDVVVRQRHDPDQQPVLVGVMVRAYGRGDEVPLTGWLLQEAAHGCRDEVEAFIAEPHRLPMAVR